MFTELCIFKIQMYVNTPIKWMIYTCVLDFEMLAKINWDIIIGSFLAIKYGVMFNICLTLSTLGKILAHNILEYFVIFPRKQNLTFHANCLQMETICMKCKILFSEKTKKHIINLSPAEFAQRMVKVNYWK